MTEILERDWRARVFPESSRLSSDDTEHRIRLNSLEKVAHALNGEPHPLLVAKPLVESQNVLSLLDHIPSSYVVWLYRPVQDVVASDLRRFGERNGINNIRPIAEGDQSNWRAQHASAETRAIIGKYFAEDMDIHEAGALFWLARNRLFFENGLDQPAMRARVMLLRYEALTRDPATMIRCVYDFVGQPFPGHHLVDRVHRDSVGKGRSVRLSPEVADLCHELLERLDANAGFELEEPGRGALPIVTNLQRVRHQTNRG